MSAATMLPFERPARGLALYPYQQQAVDAVFARYREGITRQVVSLPTGSGKTIVATHLIGDAGLPAVFLCHRDELVAQTRQKLAEFDPALSVAVCKAEQGRERCELAGRDVVIASAQTLARDARLDTLADAVGAGGLMVVDECHHSAASSWTRAIERLAPALLVGLTATPKRGDGKGLDGLYQEIVYSLPMRDLVEIGKLARPIGVRIGTDVSLDSVHTRGGDFVESEVATLVNSPTRNALVVDAWERHARDAGRQRTIAFCVDVAHCMALRETFRARGHRAEVVVGDTPSGGRQQLYRALHDGTLPVLISCMVLTEGFDEPLADCALMCRPTQSQALYIQMAGRVLRWAPGKADAVILDFVDITARHSLQTILTLAGDEAHYAAEVDEDEALDVFGAVDAGKEAAARAEGRKAHVRKGLDLLGDLLGCAPVVWQQSGDRWFAPSGQREWVAVITAGEGFVPVRVGQRGIEHLHARIVDAETAMNIAQRHVPLTHLTARDAGWRNAEVPATDGQKRAAYAANVKLPRGCTKGQAAALIDEGFFSRAMASAQHTG